MVVGSSQMGLSYDEFERLSELEKKRAIKDTEQIFLDYGADFVIKSMKELPQLVERINHSLRQGKKPNA